MLEPYMPTKPSSVTVRFSSRAAFVALCIDNEAKPPNLSVSLAMVSASLLFTVTAIFSASTGSDNP